MTFGMKLKELRHEKGMTIKEASLAVGMSQNAFANYEADTREPSYDTLRKICILFGVTADYLIGLSDDY